MIDPQLPTWFHDEHGNDLWIEVDWAPIHVEIGDGVLLPKGGRWRVVDKWFSYDRHGRFDVGYHVFLAAVADEDDRLRRAAPDYFDD